MESLTVQSVVRMVLGRWGINHNPYLLCSAHFVAIPLKGEDEGGRFRYAL